MKAKFIFLITIFLTICYSIALADTKKSYSDTADKRIQLVQLHLSKKLTTKEMNTLSFKRMVFHERDSLRFYAKIPYTDTTRQGFLLIQKDMRGLNFVRVSCKSYHYPDTIVNPLNTVWSFSSQSNVSGKTFTLSYNGFAKKVMVGGRIVRDTIYKAVNFLGIGGLSLGTRSVINVSLLFENIKNLNRQVLTAMKTIQYFIPLSFEEYPAIEFEYNN